MNELVINPQSKQKLKVESPKHPFCNPLPTFDFS